MALLDVVKSFLPSGFSVRTRSEIESDLVRERGLDSVFGFMSLSPNARTEQLIVNTAYLLHDKVDTIGILDFNIQFPLLADMLGAVKKDRPKQLFEYFRNTEKFEINELFHDTTIPNVKLITSFHNQDVYAYDQMGDMARVEDFLKEIRGAFDVVIINLPPDLYNVPFILGAKHCDFGYAVFDESIQAVKTFQKIQKTLSIPLQKLRKFDVAIFNDMHFTRYDVKEIEKIGLKFLTYVPHNSEVIKSSLEGKVYLRDSLTKDVKVEKAFIAIANDMLNKLYI